MAEDHLALWKQANQVYAQLMDLTVSDALEQLNQMAEINDEVKSLILSLISSGNQPSQYFKQHISANFQLEEGADNAFKAGDVVGGYELLEELGVGGMATVYKARKLDVESQKPVAIKLFNHRSMATILVNRFAVEQDILAGLSHPNIVNMHHGGTSEQGVPYIVMELIELAEDIDRFAIKNKASTRQKVQWVLEAARAIAYAHNNLIVHRDIKPSNLLVDGSGQLKVVDFGIAKLLTKEDAPQKTTIMALTPSFAAPEQINSGKISVTTDVFSLAAVCLALLIEDLPLPVDRLLKSCADDEAHIWQTLKTRVVDKDLRNILNQALQQDPQKRYRNMDLFADDLSAWLADKPVMATPDSWLYRISKFAKRRSALFATLSTFLATLAVAVVMLSVQYQKTIQEAAKAKQVKDFMLNVFAGADPDQNSGQVLTAIDLLSMAEDEMQYKQFDDPLIKADILSGIGAAYTNLGSHEKGERNLTAAIGLDPTNINAQLKLAQVYLDQSKPGRAAELFAQLDDLMQQNGQVSVVDQAHLLVLKSAHSTFDNQTEAGITFAQQAFELYTSVNEYAGMVLSTRLVSEKMDVLSQTAEAVEVLQATLTQVQGKMSPVNSELLQLRTTLVYLFNQMGQFEQAKAEITGVIEALGLTFNASHPARLDALAQRAMVNRNLGSMESAMQDATEAYELAQSAFGEQSQLAQQGLSMLAQLNFAAGKRKLAMDQLEQVVAMSKLNYGDEHRLTLGAQSELANYYSANGKSEAAIALSASVTEQYMGLYGAMHNNTILSINTWLKLKAAANQVDESVIAKAVNNNATAVQALGVNHPQTAYSFFVLGNVYKTAGQYEAANQAFIGLLGEGMIEANNPRYVALTHSIAENYLLAGNLPKAQEYALKCHQSSVAIFGQDAIRTVQMQLTLVEILAQVNDPSTSDHVRAINQAIDEGRIDDEALLNRIKGMTVFSENE